MGFRNTAHARPGPDACLKVGTLSVAVRDAIRNVSWQHGRRALFATSGAVILGSTFAAATSTPTFAQDGEASALEEITVTGSRIRRQDFTANSPITTIDESSFEETTSIGVETILNRLPQFVPAVTQFTTTDVQQTATNTVGASTVSLRGLGPNRNLVLIDGRRAMPVNATMVVDTNSIPSAAIERVEVISGGASAVYGADAVGGVVNFVLRDDFEGATVDLRYADTQHGGNQEITVSGLFGANVADDRGNIMFGVERSTRTKVQQWQRDWRVDDMRNPATDPTAFGWGTDTWISTGPFNIGPLPDQEDVNALFSQAAECTPSGSPFAPGSCPTNANGTNLGVPNNVRMLVNRDSGTLYSGLMQSSGAAGSYRYEGPFDQNSYGDFQGLPFRVRQPDGNIKQNNFWQWASIPLERLSAFADGHFDLNENISVTSRAMFTRTENQTSLGLTADLITFWGAEIPFGDDLYRGDPENGIPDSLVDTDGDGEMDATHPAYVAGGRYGVNCNAAPTAEEPWHDGEIGCTESEAWPTTPEIYNLYQARSFGADSNLWANRPPDYLRQSIGAARSGQNTLTTMQFSLGLEGEFPSGDHFWDVTFSTGRTDNLIIQRGSGRLSTYRRIMASPNYGRNSTFDPNPFISGFAESIATCESGLPIIESFQVTEDCVDMLSPDLKNKNQVTQKIFEANLTGDLTEMPAGSLQYALGTTYRENSYSYEPDNLSKNQNFIDPIAGLFPNEDSGGQFDVSEVYGELLIPVVSDGPTGVEQFSVELGGRISNWSMPQVSDLETYKALIDWSFTPRYRLRGGFNRAFRAPNLGELFIGRTQIFGGVPNQLGDPCSQNNQVSSFSANPDVAGSEQASQTLAMCRELMGDTGAAEYYDMRTVAQQPEVGGVGIQNSFGNPNLQEEQADTLTLGLVMNVVENVTVTVDWYQIELEEMIAVESPDSVHRRCFSDEFNPEGSVNAAPCQLIFRDPSDGGPANIDLTFTNQGRVQVSGVDLQVDWSRPLFGGTFNLNTLANYNIESITQERPELESTDWAGTTGCSLQIQCQGFEYRIFTTLGYFQGPWSISLRHQFWPEILDDSCLVAPDSPSCLHDGVRETYQLFALNGSYSFQDRYTLRFGIENLLDKEPPLSGARPNAEPFPIPDTHVGGSLGAGMGATYDPLGRRGYVSFTMDF